MTVIYANVLPNLIIMSVDSAVTETYNEGTSTEYKKGLKAYLFPEVGCVTTWGDRNANEIGFYLSRQNISSKTHTVDELANTVYRYLTEEYKPHEFGFEVGYHVAGFDRSRKPRLYHIFWGFDRPRQINQPEGRYNIYSHHEPGTFLYNGRNDLVEPIILNVINQLVRPSAIRFDFSQPQGFVLFSDFVMRFAAEITPEVSPPFLTFLITPQNQILRLRNSQLSPIESDLVEQSLKQAGIY